MTFEFTPYIWPLIVSSAIITALWVFALRYRREPAARVFLGLLTALLVWSTGFIFEIMGVELETKIFWANIQFLGITFIPFLFLILVILFTGHGRRLKYFVIVLGILAVATNVVIWSNDLHHWFRLNPWVDIETENFPILVNDYRSWFYYIHVPISYIGHFLSLIVLIRVWVSSQKLFRRQIIVLLFSLFIPMLVDVLYIIGVTPISSFNFTPAVFSISGLLIGWALFYYRLFDLVPMAYDVIVENLISGVIVLDVQNRVTVMNASAHRFTNTTPDETLGKPAEDVLWFWRNINIELHDVHPTQIEQKIEEDDTTYHYELMLAPIKSRRGQVVGRLVTINDTTEHRRLFRETKVLAISDPLTGVYNRRHFFQLLQKELDRAQRHHIPLAVMMFDIDDFKPFNDRYGHAIGDEILMKIARTCQNHLRKFDSIGRYGGDEFIILLPQTDSNTATKVAKRVCQSISELIINADGENVSLTISLGVVEYGGKEQISLDRLMQVADQAMYQAKEKGKNQFVVLPVGQS